VLNTEQSLSEANARLEEAKYALPFNAEAYISAVNEVEGYTKGLAALKALEEELY